MASPVPIEELACFSFDLALVGRGYTMSHGRHVDRLTTTVVRLTSEGVAGYGEACTLGRNYIEGFAGSVQATVRELAPVVVGIDVMGADLLERAMDQALLGHAPAKAAIDAAAWDLRGRLLRQPVATLLGGIHRDRFPLFHPLRLDTPEAMATEARERHADGYRSWQLKIGDVPEDDARRVAAVVEAVGSDAAFITCDANGTWTTAQTLRFLEIAGDRTAWLEQPCATNAEMAVLKGRIRWPLIVDESARTVAELVEARSIAGADLVNLKPTRVGGITKAARMRAVAESLRMHVNVDDPMGSDISTATVAHLAASTRPETLVAASHLASFFVERLVSRPGTTAVDGRGVLGDGDGLGFEVDPGRFREPLFVQGRD